MSDQSRGRFLDGVRERRERHRERSRIIRIAVAIAGFVIVVVGLAMIPLPGPGLLVVAAGLAVLALEFAWAERLLERTVERIDQAADTVKRASRLQQAMLGLLGVLAAAAMLVAVLAWDIPLLPV